MRVKRMVAALLAAGALLAGLAVAAGPTPDTTFAQSSQAFLD